MTKNEWGRDNVSGLRCFRRASIRRSPWRRGAMTGGVRVGRTGMAILAALCLGLLIGLPIAVNLQSPSDALRRLGVQAGARDAVMVTTPVKLLNTPEIVLESGLVYDANLAPMPAGTAISKIALESPVLTIALTRGMGPVTEAPDESLPAILGALGTLSFETVSIRDGTVFVISQSNGTQKLSELSVEISSRKGTYTAKGSATYRGSTVSLDSSWSVPDAKSPSQAPIKISLKAPALEATIDGRVTTGTEVRLQGHAEVYAGRVRQLARWFGIGGSSGTDFKDLRIKGTLDWAAGTLSFSRAAVSVDGNESTGALAISTAAAQPLIDGTLAFQHLDLSRYGALAPSLASIWPLGFGAPADDATPVLTRFDADLRLSASKITVPNLQTGPGAATITVKNGRLMAEVAELELEGGSFGGVITADLSEAVPRYSLRGKFENVDAGRSVSGLLHRNPLQGRATISLDLAGGGAGAADVLANLSGKAGLTLNEGGRLGLDLRALLYTARRSDVTGWAAAGRGQTALEGLDARFQIQNGVATAEALTAKTGGVAINGSGWINIPARTLDLALQFANPTPGERAGPEDRLTMTGNWADPAIRADRLPKQTASPGPPLQ